MQNSIDSKLKQALDWLADSNALPGSSGSFRSHRYQGWIQILFDPHPRGDLSLENATLYLHARRKVR